MQLIISLASSDPASMYVYSCFPKKNVRVSLIRVIQAIGQRYLDLLPTNTKLFNTQTKVLIFIYNSH